VERVLRRDAQRRRQDAFGLLDDRPGLKRDVQVDDHAAARAVQRGVADRRASLRGEEQRGVVRGAAEHGWLVPVQRDGARGLLIGAQRKGQAATESDLRGGAAERGPPGLRRGVVRPARLVVPQSLDDRAFRASELQVVQVIGPPVGGGEGQTAVGRGDGHRGGDTAGD
jgi:hypothetical protein